MVGRPPIYTDPNELSLKCDEYFEQAEKPTITGLTLYLGFCDKNSLYDYRDKPEFFYPIKKALTKIENYHESALDGNNVTGRIFALKNMGWKDKTESDVNLTAQVNWHEERTYEANNETDKGS